MTISDWINIVLSILSLVLAATSIVIVILTITQNNKWGIVPISLSAMMTKDSLEYLALF